MRFVWVGLGGAIGSMVRYGIGLAVDQTHFPWATLGINLSGAFILAMFLTLSIGHLSVAVITPVAVGCWVASRRSRRSPGRGSRSAATDAQGSRSSTSPCRSSVGSSPRGWLLDRASLPLTTDTECSNRGRASCCRVSPRRKSSDATPWPCTQRTAALPWLVASSGKRSARLPWTTWALVTTCQLPRPTPTGFLPCRGAGAKCGSAQQPSHPTLKDASDRRWMPTTAVALGRHRIQVEDLGDLSDRVPLVMKRSDSLSDSLLFRDRHEVAVDRFPAVRGRAEGVTSAVLSASTTTAEPEVDHRPLVLRDRTEYLAIRRRDGSAGSSDR